MATSGSPLFPRRPRWGFLYRVIPTPVSPGPKHPRLSPVHRRYSVGWPVVLVRHASAGAAAAEYAVAHVVEMALVAAVVSVVPAVQIQIKSD